EVTNGSIGSDGNPPTKITYFTTTGSNSARSSTSRDAKAVTWGEASPGPLGQMPPTKFTPTSSTKSTTTSSLITSSNISSTVTKNNITSSSNTVDIGEATTVL